MNILFRVDASINIGAGHVMRCLTLADQLKVEGVNIVFVCRTLPGDLTDYIENRGYRVIRMNFTDNISNSKQQDAKLTIEAAIECFAGVVEWVVVDHYDIDEEWELGLRPFTQNLMVIDDLANRRHDCDLILDQNYFHDLEYRYDGLVPDYCIKLLGPKFALLRPEFSILRQNPRIRDGIIRRIFIFLGGGDQENLTTKALEAIQLVSRTEISVDVVVGSSNPRRNEIQSLCETIPNVHFFCQVSNMAELMDRADLAIGAGGATTWERCSLGLPSLTVVFAKNQLQTTQDLERIGVVEFLGWADQLSSSDLAGSINKYIDNPKLLTNLSTHSRDLMRDWCGANEVVNAMNTKNKSKEIGPAHG